MNIRQLRYFCEVVDGGTVQRAAERLFITSTAISMQISQLEEGLGGRLFDRTVKPMALTSLGKFFLPRARELLSMRDRIEKDTRDIAIGKKGWLGIGFVRSLLYSVVPEAVRAFRAVHPLVKIELIEMLSEQQPAELRDGRINIGLSRLAEASPPPAGLRHSLLFEDPYVLALPAGHTLARRGAVRLSALAGLPLVSYPKDPNSTFGGQVLSALHAAGATPVVGHEAIEIHTALGLVAAGLGYAVVGASVAAGKLTDITFVAAPELRATTCVCAVTRLDEESDLVGSMLSTLTRLPRRDTVARG